VLDAPATRGATSASFREVIGNFADQVTLAARLSDLVVFGALKEGDRPGLTEAFEATLLETGRPVLLSAHAAPVAFCKKIALAWNESVASAHAVSAALPFLKCAESVEILCVTRGKDEAIDSGELQAYLALHGIAAGTRAVDAGSRVVGDVLLEEASKGGAGLLVAGGYGHSRLREMFFSGVTRQAAPVPGALEQQLRRHHYQSNRQHQPQRRVWQARREGAGDHDARKRADQQRNQRRAVDAAAHQMTDTGQQRQRYGMGDVRTRDAHDGSLG
jgi:uncharacterized protein